MHYALMILAVAQLPRVDSRFEQVSPEPPLGKLMARSPGQTRAIVLLQGLYAHPFSQERVAKPLFRDWQKSDAKLVKALVKEGDVFAFAYAQEQPVDEVSGGSTLPRNIAALRELGYREIVLVGHSAGGLVARKFVEDNPEAGVTRVIQVCAPNAGSSWAKIDPVRKKQQPFLMSLTKEVRRKMMKDREDVRIPETVQFVCVVGTGTKAGDGVVACDCQWPEDLQRQGIPAVRLDALHMTAMRSAKAAEVLAGLVGKPQPRWNVFQVGEARKALRAD